MKSEYIALKDDYIKRQAAKNYVSLEEARKKKFVSSSKQLPIKRPEYIGITVLDDFSIEELRKYIDWTPFFSVWELKGKYPAIFDNPTYGSEAKKIFNDVNKLLDQVIERKLLKAKGVFGLFYANSVGDDIEIYSDKNRTGIISVIHTLRQQTTKSDGLPYYALADFIAPKESGIIDFIGGFAVTAGIGIEAMLEQFEKESDDYSSIMIKALADRLAEAFAENLHEQVRKHFWGYAENEELTSEKIIKEQYQGIRPAPGYPACPDHTEKEILFDLLQVEKNTPIRLTESMAMYPAASVSGIYFAHPEAVYFNVGKIGKDQVMDYHKRKGLSLEEVEKWLAPNLNY